MVECSGCVGIGQQKNFDEAAACTIMSTNRHCSFRSKCTWPSRQLHGLRQWSTCSRVSSHAIDPLCHQLSKQHTNPPSTNHAPTRNVQFNGRDSTAAHTWSNVRSPVVPLLELYSSFVAKCNISPQWWCTVLQSQDWWDSALPWGSSQGLLSSQTCFATNCGLITTDLLTANGVSKKSPWFPPSQTWTKTSASKWHTSRIKTINDDRIWFSRKSDRLFIRKWQKLFHWLKVRHGPLFPTCMYAQGRILDKQISSWGWWKPPPWQLAFRAHLTQHIPQACSMGWQGDNHKVINRLPSCVTHSHISLRWTPKSWELYTLANVWSRTLPRQLGTSECIYDTHHRDTQGLKMQNDILPFLVKVPRGGSCLTLNTISMVG